MRKKLPPLFQLILCLVTFTYTLLYSLEVCARWATEADASLLTENEDVQTYIEKNGSFKETTTLQQKVLNERGRQIAAQYTFNYNGDNETFKILEAKTIKDGVSIPVAAQLIEDKPVASSSQSFDEQRQVKISFPKADIGASIYVKYQFYQKHATLDNYIANRIYLGSAYPQHHANFQIRSELPLQIVANDPQQALKIEHQKDSGSVQTIKITLQKPIYHGIISEPNNSILNDKNHTWISISSLEKWADLAAKITPQYERVLNQKLPAELEYIKNTAALEKDEVSIINKVTMMINEQIQYLGDWRSVQGRFFPHDLNAIVQSKLGDCKDFTASTGAILRQMGFKVQPALVRRGVGLFSIEKGLPDLSNFNHVMLKVTGQNQKIYWVDPTNTVSNANGIFPDISGKKALILDEKAPLYENVQDISPESAKIEFDNEVRIKDRVVQYRGKTSLRGEKALLLAGVGLSASTQGIQDYLYTEFAGEHLEEEDKKSLKVPDLSTRLVSDIEIEYAYQQKNKLIRTNLGNGLKLQSHWADGFTQALADQKSDVFIGHPETQIRKSVIKDTRVKNPQIIRYTIDTPWVYATRECKLVGNDTHIIETIKIKTSLIKAEELSSPEYQHLKNQLNAVKDMMIILS